MVSKITHSSKKHISTNAGQNIRGECTDTYKHMYVIQVHPITTLALIMRWENNPIQPARNEDRLLNDRAPPNIIVRASKKVFNRGEWMLKWNKTSCVWSNRYFFIWNNVIVHVKYDIVLMLTLAAYGDKNPMVQFSLTFAPPHFQLQIRVNLNDGLRCFKFWPKPNDNFWSMNDYLVNLLWNGVIPYSGISFVILPQWFLNAP